MSSVGELCPDLLKLLTCFCTACGVEGLYQSKPHRSDAVKFKVSGPNRITHHTWTPIFGWCVVLRTDTKNTCGLKRLDYVLKLC